jgi:hypothetical protein
MTFDGTLHLLGRDMTFGGILGVGLSLPFISKKVHHLTPYAQEFYLSFDVLWLD